MPAKRKDWLADIPDQGWYAQLKGVNIRTEPLLYSMITVPRSDGESIEDWAIKMLIARRYGIVYARPGFGKTSIIERTAQQFAAQGHNVLIIGPAAAMEQNTKIRGIKLNKPIEVNNNIITWSTFGRYPRAMQEGYYDVFLIDEISRFKISHKIAEPLRKTTTEIYASIGFTGTVVENDLEEFFKIIAVTAPFFVWNRRKLALSVLKRFVIKLHRKELVPDMVYSS